MKKWHLRFAGAVVLAGSLTGAAMAETRPLTVFAAASLATVLDGLAGLAEKTGLPPCRCVFAASSALARQIVDGAPGDIFISANRQWVDHTVRAGAMDGATRRIIARNRLILISPADRPLALPPGQWRRLPALLAVGRLAMADPDHAPAGVYGAAALRRLGLWETLAPRVARAGNVRAALALVARGEAAAGIVYASDLLVSGRVRRVARFPADSHPAIEYAAVARAAPRGPSVDAYLAFLMSPDVQARFAAHGFLAADGS